jgi:pyrophosphatase PpaX
LRRRLDHEDWRGILFDLDGTLADTVDLILQSFRHAMSEHLHEVPPDEHFLRGIGRPLPVQLREFARDDRHFEAIRRTYVDYQWARHDQMVRPFPGARAVLESLRARGVRVGVVTSKARRIAVRTLAVCGLDDVVEVSVCGDEVTQGKPDPEPVFKALAALELDRYPNDVLFVGDSPHDLVAGRSAGVRTAAVGWGPIDRRVLEAETPNFFVERMEDLLRVVPQIRPGRPG